MYVLCKHDFLYLNDIMRYEFQRIVLLRLYLALLNLIIDKDKTRSFW